MASREARSCSTEREMGRHGGSSGGSSDEGDFRQQVLPVSGAPVSLDGPPTSAEEYLRRVK